MTTNFFENVFAEDAAEKIANNPEALRILDKIGAFYDAGWTRNGKKDRPKSLYAYEAVHNYLSDLVDKGYMIWPLEGCLVDDYICEAPDDGWYNVEFTWWSQTNGTDGGYIMRRSRQLSKRQIAEIEKIESSYDED